MPRDYICRKCDYTISVGWYHYHELKDGYGARTKFACGGCGTTHYVEHADCTSGIPDRYLYLRKRSKYSMEHRMSVAGAVPEVSADLFSGFDDFVCPVCQRKGSVITEQSVNERLPVCPLCEDEMAYLTSWNS